MFHAGVVNLVVLFMVLGEIVILDILSIVLGEVVIFHGSGRGCYFRRFVGEVVIVDILSMVMVEVVILEVLSIVQEAVYGPVEVTIMN